jgi:hypothetical protein
VGQAYTAEPTQAAEWYHPGSEDRFINSVSTSPNKAMIRLVNQPQFNAESGGLASDQPVNQDSHEDPSHT